MSGLYDKKKKLEDILTGLGSVAVAFSYGVDSTFLLKIAHGLLGNRAIAVTATFPAFSVGESKKAAQFCKKEGIEQIVVPFDQFSVPGFAENPKDRCYLCKHALFSMLIKEVKARGNFALIEGSNADDAGDYRPGMRAISELSVKSPLLEAGLTKAEIRKLSEELGLETAGKPSLACLATRFPYGERIDRSRLKMVDEAERLLFSLGFSQVRVRVHGKLARVEVRPEEFAKAFSLASRIDGELRKTGFEFVSLDLGGYITGSMNRTL